MVNNNLHDTLESLETTWRLRQLRARNSAFYHEDQATGLWAAGVETIAAQEQEFAEFQRGLAQAFGQAADELQRVLERGRDSLQARQDRILATAKGV